MFGALPVFVQILYWHGTSFNSALRNQPKSAIRPSYHYWWRKSHKGSFFERYLVRHDQRRRGPGRRWGTYPREHKSDRKNPWRVCSGLVQGTCLYSFHVLLYNDCGARLSLGAIHSHLTHFWLGQKLNNNLGVSTTSMSSVTFFYKFIIPFFIYLVNCPIQCWQEWRKWWITLTTEDCSDRCDWKG